MRPFGAGASLERGPVLIVSRSVEKPCTRPDMHVWYDIALHIVARPIIPPSWYFSQCKGLPDVRYFSAFQAGASFHFVQRLLRHDRLLATPVVLLVADFRRRARCDW